MNLAKLRRARRPPSAPPSAPSSAPSSAPPSPRVELPSSAAPGAADEAAAREEETKQGILVTLLRSVPSAGAHSSGRPVSGPPPSSALFLPAYSSSSSSSPCSAGLVPTSHVFNKDFLRALAPSELLKKSAKDYLEGLLSPRAAVAILDAISTAKGDADLATVSTVRDLGGTAMLSATDKAAIKTALQHSLVLQSKFHSAIHFAQELLLSELDAESDGADSKCPEEQGGPSVSSSSSSSSSSSLNSSSSSS